MNHVSSAHRWKAALVGLAGGPEFLVTSGRIFEGHRGPRIASGVDRGPEVITS